MSLAVGQLDLYALPDWELAERMRGGDERAFEQVMRRHNRLLYRTARAICVTMSKPRTVCRRLISKVFAR